VAVERRHQQRAGALVLRAVLEEQGVLPHDRAEDRVALACVEHLGVAREDLLGVLGPREEHEGAAAGDDPDGEDVAVPAPQVGDEAVSEPQQPGALHPHGPVRTRRQPAGVDGRRRVTAERTHPLEPARGQRGGVGLVQGGHGAPFRWPY
jgi:hypothetical protein